MTPSEELLAIRERCVVEWEPGEWFRNKFREEHWMSHAAWCFLDRVVGFPFHWLCAQERTHLEVVEMIERAAVCALKDEGTL